ncbi:ATP-binding protein [Streptomyces sp. 110]|uniref:ATP-binding protein n=1 Tax=Streptomyces endocoffeicus TaxID=2898945 RepID=A0ABS1Q6Y5_9ACTN|nr:ATP-binding protein [Streptomyces endocoffeicus]MBL1120423.1 ATP-binding protein [Streptomyces endocoffeicus]
MPTPAPETPETPWSYSLRLPHDPRAAGIARTTLRAVLARYGLGELTDPATLVASEMVTNAYRHTTGPAEMRIRAVEEGRLRISVWDTNPDIPPPFGKPPALFDRSSALAEAAANTEATYGRGLLIVRICADNWGGYALADELFGRSGKLLWFELAPQQPCDAFEIAA